MALDKQRILNELGSVVNQLQSADCGCMSKLFSNSSGSQGGATMGNPSLGFGGCMSRCCHGHGGFNPGHCNSGHGHGHSASCAGEPTMNMCMGRCNPPKLYADTYDYLNQNLMKPVVNEVYNDLKSITPDNTVMNSPMAAKMGLSQQGGNPMQGDMGMQQNQMMPIGNDNQMQGNMKMPHNQMQGDNLGYYTQENMQHITGMAQNQMQGEGIGYQLQQGLESKTTRMHQLQDNGMGNQGEMSTNNGQQMANQKVVQMMGGMGPQIMSMMKNFDKTEPTSLSASPQVGQINNSIAPHLYHGQGGGMVSGQYNVKLDMTQGQYNTEAGINQGHLNSNAGINQGQYIDNVVVPMAMSNPTTQYMADPNMASGYDPNTQHSMNDNMQQGQAIPGAGGTAQASYSNPATQQMALTNGNYGQHTQGMSKFNEMFPGVMQGMGGDLGFDPMALAIQMNPANHQKAALNTMQKMMNGNAISNGMDTAANASHMKTAMAGANTAAANIAQTKSASKYGQPGSISAPLTQNPQQASIMNASMAPSQSGQVPQQQEHSFNQNVQEPVYTAYTGAPTMNQGQPPQQMQAQQVIDPATGAAVITGASGNFKSLQQYQQGYTEQQPARAAEELMIRDPIFPADTSKYQTPPSCRRTSYYNNYNTLGQPIEMLPARMYQSTPESSLPQTLSPQSVTKLRNDYTRLNLKSTVSKTSLIANKPVGRVPSRSQLQHIYNQYKGSQSYTQQNIRNPAHGSTYSERKLCTPQGNLNQARVVPVEKVGGDTVANNQSVNNQVPIKGQPMDRIGDISAPNMPHGDSIPMKESPIHKQGLCRNGLQDMVFTSYPSSAAWSFHGKDQAAHSARYRLRNRA